jgi:hypothetical protein
MDGRGGDGREHDVGWAEKEMGSVVVIPLVAKSHYICCQPDRSSTALSQCAVHQGCAAKSVEPLLSVLNKTYYGCDLSVRGGSATQR